MKESNRGKSLCFWQLLLTLVTSLNFCQAEEIAKPNVVAFLVDDMGWRETSVPFHTEVSELNRRYHASRMVRMAVEGIKFIQAYSSAFCSPTRVEQVDVYLLGGQSNMQGVGKIAEIPTEIPKEIPYTYFWTGEKFEPLVLGQTKISSRIAEFGPEVGFAIHMASAKKPVYLIKYHASGMPLHHGWNGDKWEGEEPAPGRRNFYPGEKSVDANVGTLYAAMRNQFQSGVKHLSEQGFTPTVRGFVWMQGEQDSKNEVSAKAYATSLKHLRQRLSEDMNTVPDLPLVFGQVLPHEPSLERFVHRQEIREQMAACDSSSNKPEAMKNTKMVSTDGFSLLPDTVHYDAAGQLKLGEAMAVAMKQVLSGVTANDDQPVPAVTQLKVPESSLCKTLQWKGVAIEEEDFCIWGASPIFADGQYHLFAARCPETNVDPAWRKSSEIAQYTADKPEGPFVFRRVVLQGTGKNGDWDAIAPHNPEIKKIGNKFALCYIANSDFHQPPHPLNQQIGMMVADDVNGPWKKVGGDGLVLSPSADPEHFSHGKQVVNPTLIQIGTKYHLYFKTGGAIRGTTVYGLAVSDQLTGPYRMLDKPITTNGVTIEDGTIFEWDGKICLLTTDNHGDTTGITGGGALWVSDDGVHFKSQWTQLGYQTIDHYYSEYDSQRVTKVYGKQAKFERPKVLCIENRPAWLYAPSGWNITGGKRTVNHVLKIELNPTDSPTPEVPTLRVMTFNILQGAEDAGNVGFENRAFGGSRLDEIADVIKLAQADVVGVQEDCDSDKLLQALGDEWQRIGSVYSRFPLKQISVDPYLTVVEVELPDRKDVTFVNCHWFPPRGGYGPDLAQLELRANPMVDHSEAVAKRIIEKCSVPNGARGYNATLQPLRAAIESGKTVILTGDFNEPSHLDWTERYAKEGSDRWVKNPTGKPLRFAVEWPGSIQLADVGLKDCYRIIHPDEVLHPGITWTPKYPDNTLGRRPYGDQVLDRIDRVYHSGDCLRPIAAEVVGEAKAVADLAYSGRWPSDHRAVVITFEYK
ncbi:MAG: sialate O-acetylesterase [Pirellulaceae bacterium]